MSENTRTLYPDSGVHLSMLKRLLSPLTLFNQLALIVLLLALLGVA
jgi:two-component system nitrate/nitrite sensor histidine kinase NarX